MARTTLTKTQLPGGYVYTPTTLTLTAADAVNMNQFQMVGGESIIVRNSGAVPRTITLKSVADLFGRTRDASGTLSAGAVAVFGPFPVAGWKQTDGMFYIDPDHADLLIGVLSPIL